MMKEESNENTPRIVPVRRGSRNIMFDLHLDKESKCPIAFSAKKFDRIICAAIKDSKMNLRKKFVDVWKTKRSGPASLFYSLSESHVRIETWPERSHVQGEVQLCHYTRNNSKAAMGLAECIIASLNPASTQVQIIDRGPDQNLVPLRSIRWKRGGKRKIKKWS